MRKLVYLLLLVGFLPGIANAQSFKQRYKADSLVMTLKIGQADYSGLLPVTFAIKNNMDTAVGIGMFQYGMTLGGCDVRRVVGLPVFNQDAVRKNNASESWASALQYIPAGGTLRGSAQFYTCTARPGSSVQLSMSAIIGDDKEFMTTSLGGEAIAPKPMAEE